MRRFLGLAAFLFLSGFSVVQAVPTQEIVFPQLALGGGWEAELTLVAQGAENSSGWIYFVGQDGLAMTVKVEGEAEPVTEEPYSLLYRSSQTFRLSSDGSAKVGYIVVTQLDPGSLHGSINGILTCKYMAGGKVYSQVGVLPSPEISQLHLPFNNTEGNRTSLAIAAYQATTIHFILYNEDGNDFVKELYIPFDAYSQQALYVDDLFPEAKNKRGFLLIEAPQRFNVLAMDTNNGRFSTAAAMPAVLERQVTLTGDSTETWTLRLARGDGAILTGVAERSGSDAVTLADGVVSENQGGKASLQVNLHTFTPDGTQAVNLTLIATVADDQLWTASGHFIALREDGEIVDSGTFTLTAPQEAQF